MSFIRRMGKISENGKFFVSTRVRSDNSTYVVTTPLSSSVCLMPDQFGKDACGLEQNNEVMAVFFDTTTPDGEGTDAMENLEKMLKILKTRS